MLFSIDNTCITLHVPSVQAPTFSLRTYVPLCRGDPWLKRLVTKSREQSRALDAKLLRPSATRGPLDYYAALGALRRVLGSVKGPAPIVVSEGANTMVGGLEGGRICPWSECVWGLWRLVGTSRGLGRGCEAT
jgi:hypothetical protein